MQLNKIKKYVVFFLISSLLIILDQITKLYAKNTFINNPLVIIQNVLELNYTENTGAAFGIMKGKFYFFYIITFLVILFIIYLIYKTNLNKKYFPFLVSLLLIFSGSIGNLIDRIRLGYVIDFLDFIIFTLIEIY